MIGSNLFLFNDKRVQLFDKFNNIKFIKQKVINN